jgi:hypothetical protein
VYANISLRDLRGRGATAANLRRQTEEERMSWLVELLGLLLGFLTISAINDWIQKYCPRINLLYLST